MTGTITRVVVDRGFGFVKGDNSTDISSIGKRWAVASASPSSSRATASPLRNNTGRRVPELAASGQHHEDSIFSKKCRAPTREPHKACEFA